MGKISRFLALMLCVVAAGCMALAYRENKPYAKAKKEYLELKDLVIEKKEDEKQIDFKSLKRINPDICAWISIPGTRIDYPVLIGKDDEEYLEKNFRGEYDKLGSVFAFSDTSREFTDAHICIFAHNMKKPQMFGELKKYKKIGFSEEHRILYLYTPGKVEIYRLFSVIECEKTDELFRHRMKRESKEFYKLVMDIGRRNEFSYMGENEETGDEERLITLSTCSEYERTKKRLTVHFVKYKNGV